MFSIHHYDTAIMSRGGHQLYFKYAINTLIIFEFIAINRAVTLLAYPHRHSDCMKVGLHCLSYRP